MRWISTSVFRTKCEGSPDYPNNDLRASNACWRDVGAPPWLPRAEASLSRAGDRVQDELVHQLQAAARTPRGRGEAVRVVVDQQQWLGGPHGAVRPHALA